VFIRGSSLLKFKLAAPGALDVSDLMTALKVTFMINYKSIEECPFSLIFVLEIGHHFRNVCEAFLETLKCVSVMRNSQIFHKGFEVSSTNAFY